MKKMQRNERVLIIAAGILLLSIILLIITIPGVLNDTSPNADPKSAAIGIYLAIAFRLLFFVGYLISIRKNRRNSTNRKGAYVGLGFLLILFGLFLLDGAFAFLQHQNMLHVSILMFSCTLCDFVASTITITLFFLKTAGSKDKYTWI